MRPPRIAILVLFFAASLFLFCRSITALARSTPVIAPATTPKSRFTSLFSFNAPFTLFPPNAAISLTDDNSTTFAARPAAFGPLLPTKGLSGQLWVGSGFAEDSLQDGEGEGELGCSDIPGWEDGNRNAALKAVNKGLSKSNSKPASAGGKNGPLRRDGSPKGPVVDRTAVADSPQTKPHPVDDGTDDYLHQALRSTPKSHQETTTSFSSSHADIQSIQEAAEIAGKIVLLSRGGCGFLEKVKWAQRRGAIALIVGDNQKGGPLIQMFARGDTSNVTIPSVFTARTTAHLLSSLTQPGSFIEDTIDENGRPALKVQQSDKARKSRKTKQPVETAVPAASKVNTAMKTAKSPTAKKRITDEERNSPIASRGLMSRIFHWGSTSETTGSSRPPSSGRLDWVLVDDWSDEKDKMIKDSMGKAKKRGDSPIMNSPQHSDDNFLIGVHDWRDGGSAAGGSEKAASESSKDSGAGKPAGKAASSNSGASTAAGKSISPDSNGPKGGSITPGSGEYVPGSTSGKANPGGGTADGISNGQNGILSKIFGEDDGADFSQPELPSTKKPTSPPADDDKPPDVPEPGGHDGLWVTITPSSSAGTFFDTLLVLVISPLITLTVVYALLILRARIRRRRWRAPKSVVERLPVRTYHTVTSSPSHSPRLPSPTSTSPTTPLLQQSPSRSRPRSRTTTGVPESDGLLTVGSALSRSPSRSEHEKVTSQWKKYMGRQIECVVCLEEYVDGVSRVMSLPCGHEFHAECITPWLTTRRRTCPICKGDVVRSLARGSPSSPRYEPYHDDSDDEGEETSAVRDREADVEHGILAPAPRRRQNRGEGWLGLLSSSLGSSSRSSQNSPDDRTR